MKLDQRPVLYIAEGMQTFFSLLELGLSATFPGHAELVDTMSSAKNEQNLKSSKTQGE